MKIYSFVVGFIFSVLAGLHAQTAISTTPAQLPAPTPAAITTQDANSRVWAWQTYEPAPNGQIVAHQHSYTELATGLNHRVNGQWVASSEHIAILPNGTAAAVNGQHQAYFPGDIYSGQIELVTPDGLQVYSRPLGLCYFDGTNTVLIAVLTNSIGQVVGDNQVIYPNAFTGFKVDLRYTYTLAGFEQDLILRQQPPTPESLGLNAATARLELLTEFFNPPQPTIKSRLLPAQAGLSLTDQSLGFGAMQMIQGRAFLMGQKAQDAGAMVSKNWVQIQGRHFLVEEVPVDAILEGLAALPWTAMNATPHKKSLFASRQLKLPSQRLAKNNTAKALLLARAEPPSRGFVLDYQTVNSTMTNYTFQGDTTYYISGATVSFGTNTFEGGTVLKYATGASLEITPGPAGDPWIIWQASAYRPVVFTAKDDNTVGETISGSSGSPSGYYGNPMLSLEGFSSVPTNTNLRMSYASTGITMSGASANLYDAQFVNVQNGLNLGGASVLMRNVLFANTKTNVIFTSGGSTVDGQNMTISGSTCVATGPDTFEGNYLILTNCIFSNVSGLTNGVVSVTAGQNGFYNSPVFGANTYSSSSYPFQSVGGGGYYLTNDCVFQNAGTTNIDPALLADLASRTTYPPIVYSNVDISTPTTFSPQAQRDDSGEPDLGYHYAPVDYFFGGVKASANLTFTAGTVAGWFELDGSYANAYGISITNGTIADFAGTVTAPCGLVIYASVQEGGNGQWTYQSWPGGGIVNQTTYDPADAPVLRARFTRLSHATIANDTYRDGTDGQALRVAATDCEFDGGSGGYNLLLAFTNCLFYCADNAQLTGDSQYSWETYREIYRNCTFCDGQISETHDESPPYWQTLVSDCAFDGTTFSLPTTGLSCDYNAFLTGAPRLPILGADDVIVTNFNWQSSWFGNYYLPSDSPLIDAGSTNANLLGLYHFTTQTSQTVEGDSIVDIGYHYVATDAYGNPLDSNGDGIPDYLEDANGNGLVDSGEIGWNIPGDLGLKVLITRPQNGSILP